MWGKCQQWAMMKRAVPLFASFCDIRSGYALFFGANCSTAHFLAVFCFPPSALLLCISRLAWLEALPSAICPGLCGALGSVRCRHILLSCPPSYSVTIPACAVSSSAKCRLCISVFVSHLSNNSHQGLVRRDGQIPSLDPEQAGS